MFSFTKMFPREYEESNHHELLLFIKRFIEIFVIIQITDLTDIRSAFSCQRTL